MHMRTSCRPGRQAFSHSTLHSSMPQQQVVPEGEIQEEGAGVADSDDAPLKDLAGAATERNATAATTSGRGSNGGGGGGGDGAVRWYERAYDYWEDGNNCPLDDDGVLGGYGHISPTDIAGSGIFLDELQSMRPLLGDTHAAGRGEKRGKVGAGIEYCCRTVCCRVE